MTPPSLPPRLIVTLRSADAENASKVLDSLRFRIERLIDQELSAMTPVQGVSARESSSVQLELFDEETGEMIFG